MQGSQLRFSAATSRRSQLDGSRDGAHSVTTVGGAWRGTEAGLSRVTAVGCLGRRGPLPGPPSPSTDKAAARKA